MISDAPENAKSDRIILNSGLERDGAPASQHMGADNLDTAIQVDLLKNEIQSLKDENARLSEAVTARDSFLAVAAHELMNGLSPVVGRVDVLRRKISTFPPEILKRELDRIAGLTAIFTKRAMTLLDVSRITSGRLRLDIMAVDANRVAEDVTDSFRYLAELAGSDVSLECRGRNIVAGDRLSLEQVLDNLVSNAIKYGGGKPIRVTVNTDAGTGHVRVSVSDNGPGISEADQARIFQRFERAVRPGSPTAGFGVGLWVVKQLTEAMDGQVELSSFSNQGTTFCISLPSYPEEKTE